MNGDKPRQNKTTLSKKTNNTTMKRIFKLFAFVILGTMLMVGCNKGDIPGFKKTKSGLNYKFHKTNKSGHQIQIGDCPIGYICLHLDNDTLTLQNSVAKRMNTIITDLLVNEGLLMMHVGDSATFAIAADSLAQYFSIKELPPTYTPNSGQYFYYHIGIVDVVLAEEIEQENDNYNENMQQIEQEELNDIAKYLNDNDILTPPTESGLYIIVKKKGTGKVIDTGRKVSVNYTGRLLDGTLFDSNIQSVAEEGGTYNSQRKYEPMTYVVGTKALIKGWEEGLQGLPAGSEVTLIMPSKLAYGPEGAGAYIGPFTPLIFDITILSVN